MKRRKFIQTSAVAGALPISLSANEAIQANQATSNKELYEIRTYSVNLRGNYGLLKSYLSNVLQPHMKDIGVNHFMMFDELGQSEPRKLWVLISYPTSDIYVQAQGLISQPDFMKAATTYNAVPHNNPIYSGYTSQLLLAFDGMPKLKQGTEGARLFELRTYEGYSEDAVRRKIAMFNDEELPLFDETKLHPVFFAEMISGPSRPSLVYMINFKDMEERDRNWGVFANHPDWNAMKVKDKYLNTVSVIQKVFLVPTS